MAPLSFFQRDGPGPKVPSHSGMRCFYLMTTHPKILHSYHNHCLSEALPLLSEPVRNFSELVRKSSGSLRKSSVSLRNRSVPLRNRSLRLRKTSTTLRNSSATLRKFQFPKKATSLSAFPMFL